MTRQEKVFINSQIDRLKKQKEMELDNFMGKVESINHEIKYYRSLLKEKK